MDVMVIARCMIKLFIVLVLGFVLYRFDILDGRTSKKLSSMVVKVTAPLWIISTALSASTENRLGVLVLFGAGILMYIGFILFARFVTWIFRVNPKDRPLYECMFVFSNNSFMGFPVLQSVLGDASVFYSSMLHFSFNIFIYTYAVYCFEKAAMSTAAAGGGIEGAAAVGVKAADVNITGNIAGKTESKTKKQKIKELVHALVTPGFILILLALIIFVAGIRDDGGIYETCYMIGNVTSVLSMLVLGATFAQYPVKESLSDIRSYGFAIIRLLVIPMVTLLVCRLIGVNDYYTSIATITNGMPVASMVVMMANEHNADTRIVTRNIVVTTALSLVTIPLVVALLQVF